MRKTALIMAGGRGERFWPKSRRNLPKQFLSLTDDGKTMIQLSVERLLPSVNIEDIYISTNSEYKDLVLEQLPDIPQENIILEPIGRNTAPCIGLGACHISKKYEDAIMYVLPSDHMIKFTQMFRATLEEAAKIAEEGNNMVTIGISPTYPETGYGYIKFNPTKIKGRGYLVERFVEKPSVELAKEYVATEEYLWNSGMFIWKVSTILDNINKYLPDTYQKLMKIRESIGTIEERETLVEEFHAIQSQSIDYGVMEKADDIFTVPGTFGWDDVGSWLAVERLQKSDEQGNVIKGHVVSIGTKRCIIQGGQKLLAVIGMEDTIMVDTPDATLICHKDCAGEIKKIVENLKNSDQNNLI